MWLWLATIVLLISSSDGNQGPYGNYPPQYNQQDPYNQQRQQQQQQQQQQTVSSQPNQQQQQYPVPQYNQYPPNQPNPTNRSPPPPPPGYGQLTAYGRGPPPQQQQQQEGGGLFSKLKNSLSAVGSALSGNMDSNPPPPPSHSGYGVPPPPGGRRPPGPPQYGQGQGRQPVDPRLPQGIPQGYGTRSTITHSQQHQDGNTGGGLFSKLKNIFAGDESSDNTPPPPRRFTPPPGTPGYGPPKPFGQSGDPRGYQPQPPTDDVYSRRPQQPSSEISPSSLPGQLYKPVFPGSEISSPYGSNPNDPSSSRPYGELPPPPPPGYPGPDDHFRPQQQGRLNTYPPDSLPPNQRLDDSHFHKQQPNQPYGQPFGQQFGPGPLPGSQIEPVIAEPAEPPIAPEPQIFVVDDCIVLVLKPREFQRKKNEVIKAGPEQLQVFSDFEHVFTKFRQEDGGCTYGTADVLESSSALLPQAINQLRAVTSEFEAAHPEVDDASLEDFTSRCQGVIARDGGLHFSVLPALTRDYLPRMGLREGWIDALQSLANKNVPTFLFSSGYGDIVSQALLQGGVGEHGNLPQNLRVVSNFFKTAPDGSVRAFTQPVVHERNKNATTAGRFMGFPVPDRPCALVLGSHEDDVSMAEGVVGLKETLTLGFLELTEDLTSRLPTFLNAYDAVVLSDGSFQYMRSVIDELLQVPPPQPAGGRVQSQRGSRGPSIFDRGIDMLNF